ncbi:PKD domain-containing protein [Amnibacterium sp. CER49]|uniref:PKD domain-containing protein n=1 Tax=Amnibacterium sp. CER49 TaxID=3039161 RepID=UPI0024494E48|nr:PKD domain-containing protein [Amnibacterium sp. CER49]MDH2442998.1 PKD domain-containing protein [Amnibacterium sp. CER49]
MPRARTAAAWLAALATTAVLGVAPAAHAAAPITFAVIGDVPYGGTQYADLPGFISQINADPSVQVTTHVGDISSPLNCSSSYYDSVKSMFDGFAMPFVYTPGDNEWADCHRATTGAGNPLDKLATVRSTFFPTPGTTMGKAPMAVTAQAGYPENVRYGLGDVTFAALNLPGSDNDLDTWTGLGYTAATSAQLSEESARTAADVQWIDQAFSQAKASGSRAVVIQTQADMFIPSTTTPSAKYKQAYGSIVKELAAQSTAFGAPVFLMNGDTHVFRKDTPLTSSSWLSFYGISAAVPNLTRITVQSGTSEYARFAETSDAAVLAVTRVPRTTTTTNAAPTASFTSTTSGLTASVDGSASSDSDGTVTTYAWTFGDGQDGSGSTATHTYATAGTYTVTLTVTDNGGATSSVSHSVTVSGGSTTPPTPTTLVPAGSTWSYADPASTTAPAGWTGTSFDDSAWKSGPAPLGWGSSSIKTAIQPGAASTNPLTAYYRRTVQVADPSTLGTVTFTTRADDGVVVYVNGVEAQRANMPTGTVTGGTYATSAVTTSTAVATPVTFTVPSSAFQAGTNVIAAEVHSNYHSTANTSFDLSASASGATSTGGSGGSTGSGTPLPSGTVLLPAGSTWSFTHPSAAPASGWSSPGFDTSSWSSGAAPIGWGSSSLRTTIPLPTGTNPLATYYVRTVAIPTGGIPTSGLTLKTRADDGIIVFVNGTEVGRSNLPSGTIGAGTYAASSRSTSTAVASPVTFSAPPSLLRDGTNTIAIQVQTNYHAAPDSSFDLSAVAR